MEETREIIPIEHEEAEAKLTSAEAGFEPGTIICCHAKSSASEIEFEIDSFSTMRPAFLPTGKKNDSIVVFFAPGSGESAFAPAIGDAAARNNRTVDRILHRSGLRRCCICRILLGQLFLNLEAMLLNGLLS